MILESIHNKFCINLSKAFKDDNCVYFLTEFIKGTEVSDMLYDKDLLDNDDSKFYVS